MSTAKTFLPLFPGFYGTHFEIQQYNEDEVIEQTEYKSAMDTTAILCCQWVNTALDKTGIVSKIKFEAVVSPREYNFTNDNINCEIRYSIRKLRRYLDENSEAFDKFCLERFSSCEGFASFFPNIGAEYTNKFITEHEEALIGELLEFVLLNEDYECEEYMLDYVRSNGGCWI